VQRGVEIPRLCLLAPILGKGFSEESGIGYFAPRANAVRAALGLESGRAQERLKRRVELVHAEGDGQPSMQDTRELGALGYPLAVVPGGHRLDRPDARTEVMGILQGFAGMLKKLQFQVNGRKCGSRRPKPPRTD